MIDFLTVIYNNYDLLEIQVLNFKQRFDKSQYRLIVIDNTPDNLKQNINIDPIIDKFIRIPSQPTFDGISHGNAIDIGLTYCESDIICIMDSDFFFLNDNILSYIRLKFENGYNAVGSEYNDGDATKHIVSNCPSNFENIPCCFGSFYKKDLAKSNSWIITEQEVYDNRPTGFVEVGWRIRKYILENNIKTFNWKTKSNNYGNCFFENESGNIMGVHYVAGSHRRWNNYSKNELLEIIGVNYV